ncbi:MAG: hypothetical protein N2999_01425 [Proteobacteria bacterium]|nr:hypothetical protein [Pseudomonadota bacterium]
MNTNYQYQSGESRHYNVSYNSKDYNVDLHITGRVVSNLNKDRVIPPDFFYRKLDEAIPYIVEIYDAFREDPEKASIKYEYAMASGSNKDFLKLDLIGKSKSTNINFVFGVQTEGGVEDNKILVKLVTAVMKENYYHKENDCVLPEKFGSVRPDFEIVIRSEVLDMIEPGLYYVLKEFITTDKVFYYIDRSKPGAYLLKDKNAYYMIDYEVEGDKKYLYIDDVSWRYYPSFLVFETE